MGYRTGDTEPVSNHTRHWYGGAIRSLLDHPPSVTDGRCDNPLTLWLEPDAQEMWLDLFLETEREMREGGRFEHLRDWAGKLPGAIARIAALLRLADQIDAEPCLGRIDGEKLRVPSSVLARAIALGHVLVAHNLAVYRMAGVDPHVEGARRVLAWIRRNGDDSFTAREAFNDLRGGFRTMSAFRPALGGLLQHGHILEQPSPRNGRAGRPRSATFRVHPEVLERPGRP